MRQTVKALQGGELAQADPHLRSGAALIGYGIDPAARIVRLKLTREQVRAAARG